MELLETVAEQTGLCLARYETQVAEGSMLAAVSGGVDSTALLLVLARLLRQGRLRGTVNIGHVDHGARRDSGAAVHRVQDLADRFELPFTYRRLRLGKGRPSEAAMREARYRALEEMAVETGSRILLTAHHADDNIETVLFRMMRGTGVRGLAGIPESRWLNRSLLLVRPLLKTRRATLEDLLAQVQVEAIEDPTNEDPSYARNRLRHVTIPALREAVGSGLDTSLLAVTRTARAATDMLEAQGLRLLVTHGRWITPWRVEIGLDGHPDTPTAFVEEALRQAHQSLDPVDGAPLRTWCARALELLEKPAGRRLQGRKGLMLERLRGGLLLVDTSRAGAPPEGSLPFTPDQGRFRFGATEWWLEGISHPTPPLAPAPERAGRLRTLLNPHGLPTPWRLRRRRPGDRFRPLGAEQSIDLRHFLQRRHLPRFDRDRVPLLTDAADRILWIPGVEVAADARLHLNTRRCVEVRAGQA